MDFGKPISRMPGARPRYSHISYTSYRSYKSYKSHRPHGLIPICILAVLTATLLFVPAHADPDALPEGWHTLEESGLTLQFPPELEPVARKLLPRLSDLPALGAARAKNLDRLVKERDSVLRSVAEGLGMKSATPNMKKAFDFTATRLREAEAILPDFKHIRLYPTELLDDAAKSGREVPGFTRNTDGKTLSYYSPGIVYRVADQNINYEMGLLTRMGESGTVVKVEGSGGINAARLSSFPFAVPGGDDDDAWQKTNQRIKKWLKGARGLSIFPSGAVLHETAETGLLLGVPALQGPFNRWFTEGTANYVAGACLDRLLGRKARERFLESFSEKLPPDAQGRINLAAWPHMGWEPRPPDEESDPYYAMATKSVVSLVERHGTDTILNILQRLRRHPEVRPDVLAECVQEVTGESLENLSPGAFQMGDAVAVGNVVVGPCKRRLRGDWSLIRTTNEMTTQEVMGGGVGVRFGVVCSKPPVHIEAKLFGPNVSGRGSEAAATGSLLDAQQFDCKTPSANTEINLRAKEGQAHPGQYRVELRLNGRLCKTIMLKITQTS